MLNLKLALLNQSLIFNLKETFFKVKRSRNLALTFELLGVMLHSNGKCYNGGHLNAL
jgi:hypothetical protein